MDFSAMKLLLLVKNHPSMDMQVHQLVLQHPEERERSLHQLLSLGMLTLRVLRRIFTLFLEYNANDKRAKRAAPSGLLAGWKHNLEKKQDSTIKGEWFIIKSFSYKLLK